VNFYYFHHFGPVSGRTSWPQKRSISGSEPGAEGDVSPVNVRDPGEIERAVAAFARTPNAGLIVTGSALATVHRRLIINLAARHKLPAAYVSRYFVTDGGLISYGTDFPDQYRQAAGYVDRILKGAKPADLPARQRPLPDGENFGGEVSF
jgi:putative ABC transport system substrate-binding protein